LSGPAMATPVVCNRAEAVLCEEEHLPVPHVCVQGPAVRERNGGASAPIFVVNLRSIFCRDSTHLTLSFLVLETLSIYVTKLRAHPMFVSSPSLCRLGDPMLDCAGNLALALSPSLFILNKRGALQAAVALNDSHSRVH
jgi:hypothetical protein